MNRYLSQWEVPFQAGDFVFAIDVRIGAGSNGRMTIRWMATPAANEMASAHRSAPIVNLPMGMKTTASSITVRMASHQKTAM